MARAARLISFEHSQKVYELAKDIIDQDQDDPYVLACAGMTHAFLSEDRARGVQAVRKALTIAPYSCIVLNVASWALTYVSDYDRAIECFERSLRLDPIGPLSAYAKAGYGAALLFSGRTADAIAVLQECRAENPRFGSVLQWLMMAYWEAGDKEMARQVSENLKEVVPDVGLAMTIESTPHKQPEQLALLEAAFRGVGLPE